MSYILAVQAGLTLDFAYCEQELPEAGMYFLPDVYKRQVMGVVGVGFRVNYIQSIFRDYEERYHIKAFLVDDDGTIEISTSQTGYEKTELFSDIGYALLKEQVLEGKEEIPVSYTHLDVYKRQLTRSDRLAASVFPA